MNGQWGNIQQLYWPFSLSIALLSRLSDWLTVTMNDVNRHFIYTTGRGSWSYLKERKALGQQGKKERGLGAEPPRNFLKTTHFTLTINVTNALFYAKIVFEKFERITILKKDKEILNCKH